LVDLKAHLAVAENNPAIKDVNRHMLMVMCALAFYTASLFLRLHGTRLIEPGQLAIGMNVLGFLSLTAAGWFGGKLVYGHRLDVSPP